MLLCLWVGSHAAGTGAASPAIGSLRDTGANLPGAQSGAGGAGWVQVGHRGLEEGKRGEEWQALLHGASPFSCAPDR